MNIGILALAIAAVLGIIIMLTSAGEHEPQHTVSLQAQNNITANFTPIEF
jgi:hypothetical protein